MDAFTPAVDLARALRRGEIGAVELLDHCLGEVQRLNPTLNAVVWIDEDDAREQARRWQDRLQQNAGKSGGTAGGGLPPFAGVPLPVKDLTQVEGWPLTLGSWGTTDQRGTESALVVEALQRAGFVLAGRTNVPELGPITVTENLRHGATRNPWDTERTPGGSSGGAAAAVASGMFPLAHGSDGGGSIRIPSSCCGLVGMKPSRGRVPDREAHWLGLTTEGVLCRTVTDSAAVLDCISGPDPTVWWNAPAPPEPFAVSARRAPETLRIGLLEQAPLGVAVAEQPRLAAERTAQLLEAAGHRIEPVELELADFDMLASFLVVVNAGYADYPWVDWQRVEPHNAQGYAAATRTNCIQLVQGLTALQRFSRGLLERFGRDFDVLLTPTMAIEPPGAGEILPRVHATPEAPPEEVVSMAVFTAAFNVTGQPALNVPVHWTDQGLPIGSQLIGAPWAETTLLQLGSQLEAAAPWADRRPTL